MSRDARLSSQHRSRIALTLILVAALLFYVLFIMRTAFSVGGRTYFTLVDDAMISMRYARNLANGHGLVWNIGDLPVQGLTNLGWTFLMGLFHTLPIAEPRISLLVMVASAFLLLGVALSAFRVCEQIEPQMQFAALIAASMTAFYYPLVFWSLRGMEVAAVTFLVYLSALAAIRLQRAPRTRILQFTLGASVLLALIVRVDAALQLGVILVFAFSHERIRRDVLASLAVALTFIGGITAIFAFQHRYFGSALPNTYYLKVVGVSVAERLSVGVQTFVKYAMGDFLLPFTLILLALLAYREMRRREVFLLLGLFLVQCVYSIYVGGDYAEPLAGLQVGGANRYITQGMPSIFILLGITLERLLADFHKVGRTLREAMSHLRIPIMAAACLVVFMTVSGSDWFRWSIYNAPLFKDDVWRAQLGIHLRENTSENAVIAVHAAGQIAYYSHRRAVDLLGKSDPVIANGHPAAPFRPGHNKWNYQYSILTLQPDLVADEWGESSEFLAGADDYYRLANGIWVRKDDVLLNIPGLGEGYRG